jgi:formiminoglutamase
MRLPHTQPGVWPSIAEGRFARCISPNSPEGCRLALLGLPDDTGVALNHGRPGARQGPAAFRQALSRFGTGYDGVHGSDLRIGIYDAGDIEPAPGGDEQALFATHARAEAVALELHRLGLVVVCVGGGHDLSLPTLSAASRHRALPLGGINLDAHLDVRERVGSGMPFRRLISGGFLDACRFVELGIGRFANESSDVSWLVRQGSRLISVEQAQERGFDAGSELSRVADPGAAFVSIDLDGMDQSVAPGVSAPNPLGLGVLQATRLAECAGQHQNVVHFDLMELNPRYDRDAATARVAALLLVHFVAGFQRRVA